MLKRTHYTNEIRKVVGKEVILAGWVHDIRLKGGINFLLLRDKEGIAQIVIEKSKSNEEILKTIKDLHQEDVILVRGRVVKSKIAKAGIEVIPKEIKVINKSEAPLPLDPRGVTPAHLDTKLDWRFLYFRTEEAKNIFRIQTEILHSFRKFFLDRGYIEIQPPIIIPSASEGGAELFPLKYFEKNVFLAQSPQLYKQMCAVAFEKVFMTVPVFRAEKFDQPTHLNEIRQLDIEQAFADDEDVMKVLEECFVFILKQVKKNCKNELKFLKTELSIPKLPLKRVTYTEVIEKLKKYGEKIEWGQDFSKTQEKLISKIFGDSIFIKDWPTELKPFYAMPYENNPKICKAFDLIYRGLELASGTQRIHIPELLIKQLKEKNLDPKDFKFYIDVFRYGAPPHAGWSFGLERLTMKIVGKDNIKEVTMFPRTRERVSP
ncbi:MAG: aspartate--tRNA(Asn) ligase [Candidatus Aenigmatarchaeota archaeon]